MNREKEYLSRMWAVAITHPQEDKTKMYRNERLGVIAPTLEEAIEVVKKHVPNCTIWTATHQGGIDLASQVVETGAYHLEDRPKWWSW